MSEDGNGNQPLQIQQPVRMTAKEFGSKFSTKRECFTFLTIDCRAYLPSYDTVTIYFVSCQSSSDPTFFLQLKDLITGRKKFLKDHQCKHLQVPQYKSLKVERLYEFIGQYPETFLYYPEQCELAKLPR